MAMQHAAAINQRISGMRVIGGSFRRSIQICSYNVGIEPPHPSGTRNVSCRVGIGNSSTVLPRIGFFLACSASQNMVTAYR